MTQPRSSSRQAAATTTPATTALSTLPDGRRALVLTFDGAVGSGVTWDTAALRRALADAGSAAVVILRPREVDLDGLLEAAERCTAGSPVLATAAPVTDAIKRVSGSLVVATVDRGQLAWPVPPAILLGARLRRALEAATEDVVRPLAPVDDPAGTAGGSEGGGVVAVGADNPPIVWL